MKPKASGASIASGAVEGDCECVYVWGRWGWGLGAGIDLDDQAARVCETSLVPYWPQLRRCLLFRARTQAYLEKG